GLLGSPLPWDVLLALLRRLQFLRWGVLAGDARSDLDAAEIQSFLISSSYWPRKRNPCERTTCFLSLILSVIPVVYFALSLRHISHWLALSSKAASLTIVTQSLAGHTASQTPQPQHASMFAS